jgi:CRISPR-associated endonuclease/helicase Cas3
MLVSQCSKQALPATRRILDQFAERKGDRTWLTPITAEGLKALHQLLRKSARRNTAVACHWVHGPRIDLLWIVGNRQKFNFEGTVPTNRTGRDIIGHYLEERWQHTETIALLAAIAGLFHDFGKANSLFQAKLKRSLKGDCSQQSEPIRHEWLSARLFESFVSNDDDTTWLKRLGEVHETNCELIDSAIKDGLPGANSRDSFLYSSQNNPVAWSVLWLILTHHRLPYTTNKNFGTADGMEKWELRMRPDWNSPQYEIADDKKLLKKLWTFPNGLPTQSKTWRARAAIIAKRANRHPNLVSENWRENTFVLHTARCALMLADHYYSASNTKTSWQDNTYKSLANTKPAEESCRIPHQKLDEHCVGVSHHAYLIAKSLPALRASLPSLADAKSLKKRAPTAYGWQDKAFNMALQMRDQSAQNGAFIVNMASTGTGKTLANARLAYGLQNKRLGCRFSILLGLRTLTLQTGDALRERTRLDNSNLAVLIGSSAVKTLHEHHQSEYQVPESTLSGSESSEPYFAEHETIIYDGTLDQSRVGQWLKAQQGRQRSSKLHTLLSAPVLISTIDRLIPATESARGGHQIAPMLRLLTADTIFDEPDDFGVNDLPALCRLVHWCGLLGSRVVFSSATLSPALLEALYTAYRAGRSQYNKATIGESPAICCGWVDEFTSDNELIDNSEAFSKRHQLFVNKRLRQLEKHAKPRRRTVIKPIPQDEECPYRNIANNIVREASELHANHSNNSHTGECKLSIGLVRFANIDPLVAIARELSQQAIPDNTRLHICVYHSKHPLFRRSCIEKTLDDVLARHDPNAIWKKAAIRPLLKLPERNQIVIVLATDVATTGRDHHYDWAIVEPSSMRSVIQIAGRVRRHYSNGIPDTPNMVLLRNNIRALRGDDIAFHKPGFESKSFKLNTHNLDELVNAADIEFPTAKPVITQASALQPESQLADLEHAAQRAKLFATDTSTVRSVCADDWWNHKTGWCYQLQHLSRFRQGGIESRYALIADTLEHPAHFHEQSISDPSAWKSCDSLFERIDVSFIDGVQAWNHQSDEGLLNQLASAHPDIAVACERYMGIRLRELTGNQRWQYHPWLGVHQFR